MDFGNGAYQTASHDSRRGWVIEMNGFDAANDKIFRAAYTRSATGRISTHDTGFTWEGVTSDRAGSFAFVYDYAGRLLSSTNTRSQVAHSQVFSYDRAGGMRTNGQRTCYVYGVGGVRLKKVESLAANQNCAALTANAAATVYFGDVEIRNRGLVGQEAVTTYPDPVVKLTNGNQPAQASYLHRDHLGPARAITDGDQGGERGLSAVRRTDQLAIARDHRTGKQGLDRRTLRC
ncbi:hypothetical protein [Paenirhodobacter sp.]|uniref:hypothetical protein n=1 Tax=Paenirhodobacter sp. TaxID=1965326 RepID=UPI003B412058